jgi:hypothetical protein
MPRKMSALLDSFSCEAGYEQIDLDLQCFDLVSHVTALHWLHVRLWTE